MTVHDCHCHFLSARFFEVLGREKYGAAGATAAGVAAELGWEAPGEPPALAARWVEELTRQRVSRAVLIASVPGDEASVSTAVTLFPDRFVGGFVMNPAAPDGLDGAGRAFSDLGLRYACLFPAMHRYRLDDPRVADLFALAGRHHAVVFVHCGYLSIEARTCLGLPTPLDLRFGDPLALASVAAQFPDVPVIVPHFGGGFFREALMAAEACPTIAFDTSSSNAWIRFVPGLALSEVFRQALSVVGARRLVFGTDSSFFPRGWRRVILGAQRTILDELGVEPEAASQIFTGNFERIFGDGTAPRT